ncbi:uncharacterized protein LOC143916462 [Arctopsyche grandis]|uniref:uncharacterized protein LOC143916462 n=1 Tax=Arctopsyche grandis TaxID=121162 RepID=UPI00406D9CC4
MKIVLCFIFLNVLLVTCRAEEKVANEPKENKEELALLEVESDADQVKPKRQTEEGRALGATQHFFGSAPGHYVLRSSPKDAAVESEADYLSILRQIESGGLQPAAAQVRPTVQQFLIPRQSQPTFASNQALGNEQKYIQIQPGQQKQRPLAQNLQQNFQGRIPLVLRPQGARPTPTQAIYSSPGFFGNAGGHALHEARVQAALSVGDDKPTAVQSNTQFQFAPKPQSALGDSSFERELAQLVAANQAAELKAKPQVQYIQAAPQKQAYNYVQKPKPYAFLRPDAQGPKYIAPTARAKSPKFQSVQPSQLPQQYLIETTKPQPAFRPVLKAKPQQQQYYQIQEEPKVYDFQNFQESSPNPMKIVAAPQLHQSQAPSQYRLSQKEVNEPAAPTYLQYYQAIKPQPEDISSVNDVKLESYLSRFSAQKPSASTPSEEQIYIPKYQQQQQQQQHQQQQQQQQHQQQQQQTKVEEPGSYVRYKAAKPQLSQYSSEDDALIQSLIAQSLQKPRQGLSNYASSKAASTESQPTISAPSHSSIFVSKSLVPKKNPSHSVTIEQADESEEDVQTVRLPPPKNNKVYTQDEFQALLAAGYAVTPVPVTEEEESKPRFSPAPSNYPGHSKYQASTVAPEAVQSYQKQSSESYASVTQAPRTRKVQRRRPVNSSRYRQEENQAESESQSQASYALPAERINYGMRKQVRTRTQSRQQEALEDESES